MGILQLPDEIIIKNILPCISISITDLINLMKSCRRFYNLLRTCQELWNLKFRLRWPYSQFHYENQNTIAWYDAIVIRYGVVRKVRNLLNEMSPRYFPVGQPLIEHMNLLLTNTEEIPELFIEEELFEYKYQNPRTSDNLTLNYYGRKCLKYIRMNKLEARFSEFFQEVSVSSTSEDSRHLLKGAILLANWNEIESDKYTTFREINLILEEVCLIVEKHLEGKDLSILTILTALNYVLFDYLGFIFIKKIDASYKDFFIDSVFEIKQGTRIPLCILYREIAVKLGLQCELVLYPREIIVKCWRNLEDKKNNRNFLLMDPTKRGAVIQPNDAECRTCRNQNHPDIECPLFAFQPSIFHILQQMITLNLENYYHIPIYFNELSLTVLDNNTELRKPFHLLRMYCSLARNVDHRMVYRFINLCRYYGEHLEELLEILMRDNYPCKEMIPTIQTRILSMSAYDRLHFLRPPNLTYAVGMLMKLYFIPFELDGRRIQAWMRCVIIGWDPICLESQEFMNAFYVQSINNGTNQCFYQVLCTDGKQRYVGEDTLTISDEPYEIRHDQIGVYFERFDGKRYIPNFEMKIKYPEDEEISIAFLEDN